MKGKEMRTKLFTRPLVVVVGLVASAYLAGPALANDPAPAPGYGYVEVCKDASAITPGTAFQFTIDGLAPILVKSGQCSPALRVPVTPPAAEATSALGTVKVTENDYVPDAATGFDTSDWTVVSAIHTTAPGAPDAMLKAADLGDRTATLFVAGNTDESQATVVHFTNDPVNGYFEICKDQVTAAGLDGQMFTFDWVGANGAGGSVSVPVGGCSLPINAPAGHVIVTEDGTNYVDTTVDADGHPGIWGVHDGDVTAMSIADAEATVSVTGAMVGDTTEESIVHFRNNSSLLKICKVVPIRTGLDGLPYSFNVTANGGAAHSYGVSAFVKWRDPDTEYGCVTVGTFRAGTSIVVTEVPQPGQAVDAIWLEPSHPFVQSGSDFLGQTATLTLQSGETEVFYKNAPADPQHLKICKNGGGPNTTVNFTVTGPLGTAPDVEPAQVLAVAVPLNATGSGCAEAGDWSYIGPVTVAETIPSGFAVTAIDVATPDRLVAGSKNLATGVVGAYIGDGTTVVTYTNADPPQSAGGASSSAGSGSSTAAPAATATPTSQPTTATAPAKQVKGATAAYVVSVKIVTVHGKRYVSVRMAGPNAKTRVHLRLIDRHGTVMKNAVRTVKTNVTTRILDLPVSKSIVKVRAIPVL